MKSFIQLTLIGLLPILASACAAGPEFRRPGRANADFVPGVEIAPDQYRIDGLRCEERMGTARVDGDRIDERQWLVSGTLANAADEPSVNYDIEVVAELSSGQTIEVNGATIFPLLPGDSSEFNFLFARESRLDIADEPIEVVNCTVRVLDSVLNYAS